MIVKAGGKNIIANIWELLEKKRGKDKRFNTEWISIHFSGWVGFLDNLIYILNV